MQRSSIFYGVLPSLHSIFEVIKLFSSDSQVLPGKCLLFHCFYKIFRVRPCNRGSACTGNPTLSMHNNIQLKFQFHRASYVSLNRKQVKAGEIKQLSNPVSQSCCLVASQASKLNVKYVLSAVLVLMQPAFC